jgi:hypothetical protein
MNHTFRPSLLVAEVEEESRAITYGTSWTSAYVKILNGTPNGESLWEDKVTPSMLDTGKIITDAELYDAINEIAEESFREQYTS